MCSSASSHRRTSAFVRWIMRRSASLSGRSYGVRAFQASEMAVPLRYRHDIAAAAQRHGAIVGALADARERHAPVPLGLGETAARPRANGEQQLVVVACRERLENGVLASRVEI